MWFGGIYMTQRFSIDHTHSLISIFIDSRNVPYFKLKNDSENIKGTFHTLMGGTPTIEFLTVEFNLFGSEKACKFSF